MQDTEDTMEQLLPCEMSDKTPKWRRYPSFIALHKRGLSQSQCQGAAVEVELFIFNSFISCFLFYINDINYEMERLSSVKPWPILRTDFHTLVCFDQKSLRKASHLEEAHKVMKCSPQCGL